MKRATPIGSALVAAILALPVPAGGQQVAVAVLESHAFEAAGGDTVDAEIGRFRVPLNRRAPGGDSLVLAFVRFASTSPDPGPPIVYLAGGPGGSGVAAARGSRFGLFMALREFGDVIAFDQRGTGMSDGPSPSACPIDRPYPADRPLERAPLEDLTLAVARECGEFWRQHGVELDAYNTNESADDLAALAAAIGAPSLRLWAISYGTHLALATMRRHPRLVERAILAGLEGPDHTVKLPSSWDHQVSQLERLIAADPRNAREFPDLRGTMAAVLERLADSPAPVEVISADEADTTRTTVSRFAVQRRTIDLLRDPPTMITVPHLYRRMAEGDFSALAEPTGAGGFEAMPAATDAASGISPGRLRLFHAQDSATLLGGGDGLIEARLGTALGVADLGHDFRRPVHSDAPVLLISGTLDGRTPVGNALEVMEGLTDARHLIIENAGHSDDLFLSSPRILDVMRAFLADRTLPATRLAAPPPDLEDGRLPPVLSHEFIEAIVGAYERGPADVWRVVHRGSVRSLGPDGAETGRTTFLQMRIRGNGYPLVAAADTSFVIPSFPDVRFRFRRGGDGAVTRLDYTSASGETTALRPVRWDAISFVDGRYWLVAGPFQLPPGADCALGFPVEDLWRRDPAAASASWVAGTGDDAFVDFEESFDGSVLGGVGYATLVLEAEAAMEVQLRLGSDDDARVFLGPEQVHAFDGSRAAWEAQDVIPVRLREGANHLLVKVCNRDSDWRFNLRITDETGRSLLSAVAPGRVGITPGGAGATPAGGGEGDESGGGARP